MKLPSPKSPLQFIATLVVLAIFAAAVFAPMFTAAKLDTGLIETVKNVTLIVVGWLFGASMQRDQSTPPPPAVPAPPKEPTP